MVTALEKLIKANRWRIKSGSLATSEVDGFNGAFLVPLEGELWFIIASDKLGWKHVSVSNSQKKVLPNWTIMSRVKGCFFGDDEAAVIYLPSKEDHINDHPYTHHLWMPLDEPMPKPPIVFV
jgi:hypothetical protein